jgi:hypothetical protein
MVRKSADMLLLEARHGNQPIDMIILRYVREAKGVCKDAAKQMSIAPPTLTRWLVSLNLHEEVNSIRRQFKRADLPSDETSNRVLASIENIAHGNCIEHNHDLRSIPTPLEMVDVLVRKGVFYAVVRDAEYEQHTLPVNAKELVEA